MKKHRHAAILRLIDEHAIETQDELAEWLRREEIDVTQATVSRDIKELRLVKVAAENGRYRYSQASAGTSGDDRAVRTFYDYVQSVETSGNLVVIKTLPGTAPAVASVIDEWAFEDVIGTIAGDDAILLIVRDLDAATGREKAASPHVSALVQHLRALRAR